MAHDRFSFHMLFHREEIPYLYIAICITDLAGTCMPMHRKAMGSKDPVQILLAKNVMSIAWGILRVMYHYMDKNIHILFIYTTDIRHFTARRLSRHAILVVLIHFPNQNQ